MPPPQSIQADHLASHQPLLKQHGYEMQSLLGSGEMGYVYLCSSGNNSGQVAVKVSLRSEKSRHELTMHRRVSGHPNVVQLRDHFESTTHQYLVMDYLNGGNLLQLVTKRGSLSISSARRYFEQLLSCLDYCHAQGVIHRDVKLENIMLDESTTRLYLTDWDLAGEWSPDVKLDKFCGSPHYAAPEIFKGIKYTGPELDVWSAGVVLFCLLCGRFPFNGASTIDIAYRVQRGELAFPPHVADPNAHSLLRAMLCVDVQQRATIASIYQHPFLADVAGPRLTRFSSTDGSQSNVNAAITAATAATVAAAAAADAASADGSQTASSSSEPAKRRASSRSQSRSPARSSVEATSSGSGSGLTRIGVSNARSRIFESRNNIMMRSSKKQRRRRVDPDAIAASTPSGDEAVSTDTSQEANDRIPAQRARSFSIDIIKQSRVAQKSVRSPSGENDTAQVAPVASVKKKSASAIRSAPDRGRRLTIDSGSIMTISAERGGGLGRSDGAASSSSSSSPTYNQSAASTSTPTKAKKSLFSRVFGRKR